jgi:CRISPR/Cas system-associated exonuclease Cas4 (RecB family)
VAELTKIEHLAGYPKRLLSLATVLPRIESFLEDLNVDPLAKLNIEFDLGGKRRTEIFHASTIGTISGKSLCGKYTMGCARVLYYDVTGAPSEGAIDPRLRRIFDTGSAVHAQLQGYLEVIAEQSDGEYIFEPEVDINPQSNEVADMLNISGHTDGDNIVTTKKDKVRFLLEIKTINDAGYKKTKGPHPEHLIQGTVYQKCLDVPLIVFLYYNKNDSSMAEFVVEYDERRWQAVVDKLDMVMEHAMEERPPVRETGWHCSNCKYKGICKPPKRGRGPSARTVSAFRSKKES